MKKFGLIFFIGALIVGFVFARSTSFGTFRVSNVFGGVSGSGVMKNEKRDVANFTKIDGSGALNIEVVIQKEFSVEVEADDNLLQNIKTEVRGNTLKIYSEGRISRSNPVNVRIGMPVVEGAEISGASKASLSDVSGDNVVLEVSGASKIVVNGEVKNLKVQSNGASSIDAENLKAENADVDVNGASKAIIFATNELKADANGASRITYVGDPVNLVKSSNGGSSIKKK